MSILIISTYRCGGTSLTNWIAEESGFEAIHEPYDYLSEDEYDFYQLKENFWMYNYHNKKNYRSVKSFDIFTRDDLVVKLPYNFCLEPIETFINKFDKKIVLSRRNLRDSAESMIMAKQNNIWQKKYQMSEQWIKDNNDLIKKEMLYFKSINNAIKSIPILHVTYENLFQKNTDIKKLEKYLKISYNPYWLDQSNRLRNGKRNFI